MKHLLKLPIKPSVFSIGPTNVFRFHLQTSFNVGYNILTYLITVVTITLQMRSQELDTSQDPEYIECCVEGRIKAFTRLENGLEPLDTSLKRITNTMLNRCPTKSTEIATRNVERST